jgi:hypothetical protein
LAEQAQGMDAEEGSAFAEPFEYVQYVPVSAAEQGDATRRAK